MSPLKVIRQEIGRLDGEIRRLSEARDALKRASDLIAPQMIPHKPENGTERRHEGLVRNATIKEAVVACVTDAGVGGIKMRDIVAHVLGRYPKRSPASIKVITSTLRGQGYLRLDGHVWKPVYQINGEVAAALPPSPTRDRAEN